MISDIVFFQNLVLRFSKIMLRFQAFPEVLFSFKFTDNNVMIPLQSSITEEQALKITLASSGLIFVIRHT